MRRTHGFWMAAVASVAVLSVGGTRAAREGTSVTPKGDLQWSDAGVPGVATAAVDGDPGKGQSHFYLRYAAGLVTPLHHHSPDHYGTTVSGTLVLVIDGQERKLPPGSFFAITKKAPHAARCEGSEDCVMFIDARGPWDAVPEK